MSINFSIGVASLEQIFSFILDNDDAFVPSFSSNVNLEDYSKKIFEKALSFEAWEDGCLVGLLVVYQNDETKTFYIPYFCVRKKGVGHLLFNFFNTECKEYDVVELEVRKTNIYAISFYEKLGFYQISESKDKLYLRLNNMNNEIKVSIACVTYNHMPYIRECLKGFLMQKTNFKYEILIHDDASTDGTADIIREYEAKYPDIIKPIYQKENQYSKGISPSIKFNFPRVKGKYIAMCEGDDYWTDPYKLQKQVDFLDEHNEYSCSFHLCNIIDEKGNVVMKNYPQCYKSNYTITLENLLLGPTIPQTLSVVFRTELISSISTDYKVTDIFLYYFLLKQGNAMCISENMGVYRNHSKGVWSKLSYSQKFVNSLKVRLNIYNADKTDISALFVILLLEKYPRSLLFKNLSLTYKVCNVLYLHWGWKYSVLLMLNKIFFNKFPLFNELRDEISIV